MVTSPNLPPSWGKDPPPPPPSPNLFTFTAHLGERFSRLAAKDVLGAAGLPVAELVLCTETGRNRGQRIGVRLGLKVKRGAKVHLNP